MCNEALTAIGEKIMADFDTPTNDAERLCSSLFDETVDEVSSKYNWHSISTRAEIAASSTDPDFGYDTAYPMPSNCLRVKQVFFNEVEIEDWEREGRNILTNTVDSDDEAQITYLKRVTDVSEFDPHLAKVIWLTLAFKMTKRRTQSRTFRQDIRTELEEALREARTVNAMEEFVEESNDDVVQAGR
jgi:hypothetical protein